jgi:hypothetical protein
MTDSSIKGFFFNYPEPEANAESQFIENWFGHVVVLALKVVLCPSIQLFLCL